MTLHRATRRGGRMAGRGLALLTAFLAVPAVSYLTGNTAYQASLYTQPEAAGAAAAAATGAAAPSDHDPAKPTAVVVAGNGGANVADTLVTYDVLATTGAFNVYTVAPERRPLPLTGGLDLVPDLSFEQLDELLGGQAPDVTVVPAMPSDSDAATEASYARVTSWLRDTASGGLVMSVCTGAEVIADAGLLDGRDATSHWYRLGDLEQDYPQVNWQRGIRYVDDGDVITTGGLLSNIDGTLRVIERLVDADTAAAAAQAVGWRYYSPGTAATMPTSSLEVGDALLSVVNAGFRWESPTLGVVLTDGVGELELAAAVDPWVEHPSAARILAVAPGAEAVRSRHGLTFLPRADLRAAAEAGRVDRLLVPGVDAAATAGADVDAAADRAALPVTYLHEEPGFAFDPALREVAGVMDVPTARWSAKLLELPSEEIGLSGPGVPWHLAARPFLAGLAGLAVALGAVRLARAASARRPGRRP